ncbi:MAG: nucleotidyltransferase domain-containing protein [Deltaproteobacteria bacterium]|nr:nucleotidyltransferase domain-containing protein [Deltaproteobacteria bacterium]
MLDKDQVDKIVGFAEAHPEISAVYLFGSFASGHPRAKSDIDLGVLFFEDVDSFFRVNLETTLSNLLRRDVDLIDMRKSSPFLRHQIYKYGRAIYHGGGDFPFQFRANSIREYLETGYIRKIWRKKLYGQ